MKAKPTANAPLLDTSTSTTATSASSSASSSNSAFIAPLGTVATISTAQIQALESACTTFAVDLGTSGILLNKTATARLPKARKNAPVFVNAAVLAGNKYKIVSPSYSTTDIAANQQLATDLVGAIDAVETLLKLLKDTSLLAQSSAWSGALVLYKMLSAEAPSNPAIATTIQPLREQLRPQLLTPSGTKTVKRAKSANAIAKAKKAASGSNSPSPVAPPPAGATSTTTNSVAVGHS